MDELRVLVADDHDLIRRGVRDLLASRSGWRVVGEACTGTDAVKKAVELKPDVAILDFSMPELNGPAEQAPAPPEKPEKKPDALKAARAILARLAPFSPKKRQGILQMAALLCDEEGQ